MVTLQAALTAMVLSAAGQTVLLDFYADWCGPCRAMNPTVEALVARGYNVRRVNIDQNRELAARYNVRSIPCFVMLVGGQEADRIEGGTTFSRLERMCKLGTAPDSPPLLSMRAQNPTAATTAVAVPASPAPMPPMVAPPSGGFTENGAIGPLSDAALIAASVRLHVEDPSGRSCGTGTIIDARDGEALILTCGHIFRDSQGKGRIIVDLFGGSPQQVEGRLISFSCSSDRDASSDSKPDIGLVSIRTSCPVAAARLAPPGYRVDRGAPVVSVGCNNGALPTANHSQVTSLDKFIGPPNIQVAGQPVEGRSGGGLFSAEGYVIGVCNAADPSDKEGLFAAIGSIQAELDRNQLAFVYQTPRGNFAGAPGPSNPSPQPAAIAAMPSPAAPSPNPMPGPNPLSSSLPGAMPANLAPPTPLPASLAAATTAAGLSPSEQAALDELRRHMKEGAEIILVVRPRGNPDAPSEVIMLNRASQEFLKQLAVERQRTQLLDTEHRQQDSRPASTLPTGPRKKILEWSAAEGTTVSNLAALSGG